MNFMTYKTAWREENSIEKSKRICGETESPRFHMEVVRYLHIKHPPQRLLHPVIRRAVMTLEEEGFQTCLVSSVEEGHCGPAGDGVGADPNTIDSTYFEIGSVRMFGHVAHTLHQACLDRHCHHPCEAFLEETR